MSDFNPAYSYQPMQFAQNDVQEEAGAQGARFQIGNQESYDGFFKNTGVAASSESASADQRQRAMDFAGSLGYEEGSELGENEFRNMGDLVNGDTDMNTLAETGEIGPNANYAEAEEHMQAFRGGRGGQGGGGCGGGQGGGRGGWGGQESGETSQSSGWGDYGSGEEEVTSTGSTGGSTESDSEVSTGSVTPSSTESTGGSESTGGTASTGSNGELVLGNTSINLTGGTDAERALVEESFASMYENNAAFKEVIDSKSGTGITVNFQEFTDNTAGMATVGGTDMTMDIGFLNDNHDPAYVAEVIAHEVGHLAGMGHGDALDSFAVTAGQSIA